MPQGVQAFRPAVLAAVIALSGCAPKVKYVQPTVEVAPAFRENAEWKPAQPARPVSIANRARCGAGIYPP
jgi:hypothetical protein